MALRVVAGEAKGRRLAVPPGRDVRPTGDRVREAVFNALGSLDAVEGADVLDLFAGSGALGIEALSRGAASVVFVERDRAAAATVEANLASTGLSGGRLERRDAMDFLADRPGPFDLALLDPPYAYDGWDALLGVVPAGLIVVESDREIVPGPPWDVLRSRTYGGTVVLIARRREPPH